MGINTRLNALKGDMMYVKSQLQVIELMDVEDKNKKIAEIIDMMTTLIQEVAEIQCDNSSIQRDMNKLIEKML